jgi:hypothetical protein
MVLSPWRPGPEEGAEHTKGEEDRQIEAQREWWNK